MLREHKPEKKLRKVLNRHKECSKLRWTSGYFVLKRKAKNYSSSPIFLHIALKAEYGGAILAPPCFRVLEKVSVTHP